jgi:hypothetical protein
MSSTWFPSFRCPHQTHVCISPLPLTCHKPRQSHPSLFEHPNITAEKYMWSYYVWSYYMWSYYTWSYYMWSYYTSLFSTPLPFSFLSLYPVPEHVLSVFLPEMWVTKFQTRSKKKRQIYRSLIFYLCDHTLQAVSEKILGRVVSIHSMNFFFCS